MLTHGNVCWFEIPTLNVQESKEFYSKLFGWEFSQDLSFSNDYWFISTAGEGIGGGLFLGKPTGTPSIIPYFVVGDMADTLEKAENLGGKVIKPKTLITKEAGYFAQLYDNQDNLIAFWSRE